MSADEAATVKILATYKGVMASLIDKPSIAVLPFDNLSGDPTQDYLSDGLTDELIATLSRVPNLFVIARNSTFTYKSKPVEVQEVSETLGVRYVLEGRVKKLTAALRKAVLR